MRILATGSSGSPEELQALRVVREEKRQALLNVICKKP